MRAALLATALVGANAAALIPRETQTTTFDYIVVGGGTAGLTIAKRLWEHGNVTVAVIEAGGVGSNITELSTPGDDTNWIGSDVRYTNLEVDWGFVTSPQPGAGGRSLHFTRGKVLGGSSARNYMMYQRGSKGSYQVWADNVGDQSYTFDNLLPHFQNSVNFTKPRNDLRFANASVHYNASAYLPQSPAHPLDVSYSNYAPAFSTWVMGAYKEIGMGDVVDFISGKLIGSTWMPTTIQGVVEKRETSQTAFVPDLTPGAYPGLTIYSHTLAKKVIFNKNKAAVGVQVTPVTQNNTAGMQLTARKEVILSAGAFQSPQLLMVSGVGPKAQLAEFNIPVVKDLPGVGQNMWDHVFFGPSYRVNEFTATELNVPSYYSAALQQYNTNQTGILTSQGCDAIGWEKAPHRGSFSNSTLAELATLPADWPEIEYMMGIGYVGNFSNLPGNQPKDGYQYGSSLPALVAPFSRGNVTLKSNDTKDLPIINPNWLTSKTDQEMGIAAFKRARDLFNSKFMAPNLVDKVEYYPGPSVQSDADILKFVQDNLLTVWHPACTCKMGNKTDPMAVVDTQARVYGVTGLRVVDAAAFNVLPPGHPQSTVYMLAEKIAKAITSAL